MIKERVINMDAHDERRYIMDERRYIIDDIPVLTTWLELITHNIVEDVGGLSENEIVRITRLKVDNTLPIDHVIIKRVL